jgi:hypothetical protein
VHISTSTFIIGWQRLSAALHATLGSYLRDALLEGGATGVVACLPVPRTQVFIPLFSSFRVVAYSAFSRKNISIFHEMLKGIYRVGEKTSVLIVWHG